MNRAGRGGSSPRPAACRDPRRPPCITRPPRRLRWLGPAALLAACLLGTARGQDPGPRSFVVDVRDEAGRPVAGAFVAAGVVRAGKVDDVSVVQADADGVAWFDREPRADLWVVGHRRGLAFGCRNLLDPTGRAPTPLVLPLAQHLAGTVVDLDGRPIAGAEVRVDMAITTRGQARQMHMTTQMGLIARQGPIEAAITAQADEDGRFLLDSVPAGATVGLVASAPGRVTTAAPARTAAIGAREATADVRIALGPESRMRGRVSSEVPGVEVAGRAILVLFPLTTAPGPTRFPAFADAQGHFDVGGLPAGRAKVLIDDLPADAPWTFVGAEADVAHGKPGVARVAIIAGTVATGTVAEVGGKPVAGIDLVVGGEAVPRFDGLPHRARTDAAGIYRFRLPPGPAMLGIVGPIPGHLEAAGARRFVTIPAGVATFAVEPIILTPASR